MRPVRSCQGLHLAEKRARRVKVRVRLGEFRGSPGKGKWGKGARVKTRGEEWAWRASHRGQRKAGGTVTGEGSTLERKEQAGEGEEREPGFLTYKVGAPPPVPLALTVTIAVLG